MTKFLVYLASESKPCTYAWDRLSKEKYADCRKEVQRFVLVSEALLRLKFEAKMFIHVEFSDKMTG